MPRFTPSPLRVPAVLTWVLIQLVMLAFGASGIPLWPSHPLPRESIAASEMIVIQIVAMAMLFPLLLPNLPTALAIAATVWPFLHLAGFLSVTPERVLVLGCSYVSIWIGGLWLCNAAFCSESSRLKLVAFAQLLSVGGALLWYLHLEAANNGPRKPEIFGPLLGAVYLVNGITISWIGWAETAIPLAAGLIAWRIRPTARAGDSMTG